MLIQDQIYCVGDIFLYIYMKRNILLDEID